MAAELIRRERRRADDFSDPQERLKALAREAESIGCGADSSDDSSDSSDDSSSSSSTR